MLAAQRPTLIPSHEDDAPERVRFVDGVVLEVPGHGGAVRCQDDNIYMAIALRNGGSGVALIHAWRAQGGDPSTAQDRPRLEDFRHQTRDLFVPSGETGFWQGAIRDRDDPAYDAVHDSATERQGVIIDILYGDHEGAQKGIVRFLVSEWPNVEGDRADIVRYWNIDVDGTDWSALADR